MVYKFKVKVVIKTILEKISRSTILFILLA